jgi:tetratricopeptide (TPR) repeat protein
MSETVPADAPTRPPLAIQQMFVHVALAMQRGEWLEALRSWQKLLSAVPDARAAYAMVGAELHARNRLEEADIVFAEGMTRFPKDAAAAVNHAWTAHARQNWPEAKLRWQAVCERFPGQAIGPLMLGSILIRQLGQPEEGEAMLTDALQRFPDDANVANEHAWAAGNRGDHEESLSRYRAILARFPDDVSAYQGASRALVALGRTEEGEAMLQEALRRFPDHPHLLFELAHAAEHRSDWAEAAQRWEALADAHPDNAGFVQRRDQARARLPDAPTG